MTSERPHALQRYWELAAASVQAQALDTALELNLFEPLAQPASAAEAAHRLELHAEQTGHLLEILWSMGLLNRIEAISPDTPARYQCDPEIQRYFLQGHAEYCADAWRYRLKSLRHFSSQMLDFVRDGKPKQAPFTAAAGSNWAEAARLQIGQEQRAVTQRAALAVLAQIPQAAHVRRFLDLGGGPGWVAIALAQAHPAWTGVVCDWPETVAVAQENIAATGLTARLDVLGADLVSDTIGGNYDLIWCSSVLHFLPDMVAALEKIRLALKPGGVLVAAHGEVPEQADAASRVLPFYMPMLMLGRRVTRMGGMRDALEQAGFESVWGFDSSQFPMAPVHVLVARKPL